MKCNDLFWCLFGISACFWASAVAHEAIIGGELSRPNEFPYQVSVQIPGNGHVCGGGIIGDQFILTAAHCVLNRTRNVRSKEICILAGTNSLNKPDNQTVSVQVEKVFFPKEFHPTMEFKLGDVAVLKLAITLQLEHHKYLKKLELPNSYHLSRMTYITGFGWNEIIRSKRVGGSDGQLWNVVTNILSDNECIEAYPPRALESDKHICGRSCSTMHHDRSVCMGDAGGPLVLHDIAVGILSRIPTHCDERNGPAVYIRLIHYAGMILNIMERDRDPHMISLYI